MSYDLRSLKPLDIMGETHGRGVPTVVISHEPWGEVSIGRLQQGPALEVMNPRIAGDAIRFLAPDIALVDGDWDYRGAATRQTKPLAFVMKREGGRWKIASARLLAALQ